MFVNPNRIQQPKTNHKHEGKVAGTAVGAGLGGAYVAATRKDAIAFHKAQIAQLAKKTGSIDANKLKQLNKCAKMVTATIILAGAILGFVTGSIIDVVKNKKAQNTEKEQMNVPEA